MNSSGMSGFEPVRTMALKNVATRRERPRRNSEKLRFRHVRASGKRCGWRGNTGEGGGALVDAFADDGANRVAVAELGPASSL